MEDINRERLDNGYRLLSFDVQSLFTDVRITKTNKIISDTVKQRELLEINIIFIELNKQIEDRLIQNVTIKFMSDMLIAP